MLICVIETSLPLPSAGAISPIYIAAKVIELNAKPPNKRAKNNVIKVGANAEPKADIKYIAAITFKVAFRPYLLLDQAANGNAIKTPIPGPKPKDPTCHSFKLNSAVINLKAPDIKAASSPNTKPPKATIVEYKKAFFLKLLILVNSFS